MSNKIRCLVFSGGGIRGLAYVGCLKALEEFQVLPQIESYVGTSIGAIFALFLNLDYCYEELYEILLTINFESLRDITSDGIFNYFNSYGFETGNKMENIVKIFIRKKIGDDQITFQQLYEKTQRKLTITGTCLNTCQGEFFNYENCPNMEVIKAIRISMSIPFVFTTHSLDGKLYVDGGVANNYPLDAHPNTSEILGFVLKDNQQNKEIQGLDDYAMAIIQSIDKKLHSLVAKIHNDITITITTKAGVLDFNISEPDRKSLFMEGYQYTADYLTKNQKRIITKQKETNNSGMISEIVSEIGAEYFAESPVTINDTEDRQDVILDLEMVEVPYIIDITTRKI